MGYNHLSTYFIARKNLARRPFRTACLATLVTLLAFTLFGGGIVYFSLLRGLDSIADRLGGDALIVVPEGYERKVQGVYLRGDPSTFYLDKSVLAKIGQIRGVKDISPQLFVATLKESCCSLPVQLIGFDPRTDFSIKPWLAGEMAALPGPGEIIVGNMIEAAPGETLEFFNQPYKVLGRLAKTGMGYDTTVFMTIQDAQKLLARQLAYKEITNLSADNLLSSINVNVQKDYDVAIIGDKLRKISGPDKLSVIVTQNMLGSIKSSADKFLTLIYYSALALWLLALLVLLLVFSLTFNERLREFAIYRTLGASRRKLYALIFSEAALLSLCGASTGILLAALLVFPFNNYISQTLQIPYLLPAWPKIAVLLAASFTGAFAVGPLATLFSARKLGQAETYTVLRENEI